MTLVGPCTPHGWRRDQGGEEGDRALSMRVYVRVVA